jgi:hypothetical protein
MRMDLREIGLGGVDWIRLAQDRDRWRAVVSTAMNLRVLAPRRSNQGELSGQAMWHSWERGEKYTRFWWESPKERDLSEDRGVDGSMGSKWVWTGGGLL